VSGRVSRAGARDAAARAGVPVTALEPVEALALRVALAQVMRGEPVGPNVAAVCVMALARLTGTEAESGRGGEGEALAAEVARADGR
jgi:hypothetical protein